MKSLTCNLVFPKCVQVSFLVLYIVIATNVVCRTKEAYAFQVVHYATKNVNTVQLSSNKFSRYRYAEQKITTTTKTIPALSSDDNNHSESNEDSTKYFTNNPLATRRDAVIQSSSNIVKVVTASSLVGVFSQQQQLAFAQEQQTMSKSSTSTSSSSTILLPGTYCLQDLPVLDTTKFVRIYLCRHGQTENNRLQKVQGVRLNPSINDTGMKQAFLLGQALALANNPPELYYSSSLERAKVTASVSLASALAVDKYNNKNYNEQPKPKQVTETVPSILEIDFGPIAEGVPVDEVRAKMISTYAQWSIGNIDARMDPDGESGAEVLQRIEKALSFLVGEACKTQTGTIVAVAHSVYLRVLLSTIGQKDNTVAIPSPRNMKQSNCCVNVIDFPRSIVTSSLGSTMDTTVSRRDVGLFNRLSLSKSKNNNNKSIAEQGKIIRINENRHLGDLA